MGRTATSVLITSILVMVTFFAARPAAGEQNPFRSLHVASNWGRYAGQCPADLLFTGTIVLRSHPNGLVFNYYWLRSDGSKSETRVMHPAANQGSVVVREHWRLGAQGSRYSASMRLFVNSGNTHIEDSSRTVQVICK